MHTRRCSALLAGLSTMALGCQSAPDISDELERFGDHAGSILALSCECPEELGYESSTDCYDAQGIVGADERACLAAEAEGYESELEDYLGCALPALEAYGDCLYANDSCAEGHYALCVSTFEEAEAMCSPLPSAISEGFYACVRL